MRARENVRISSSKFKLGKDKFKNFDENYSSLRAKIIIAKKLIKNKL